MIIRIKETFETAILCESKQDEVVAYYKRKLHTFKRSEIQFEGHDADLGWNYSLIDTKLSKNITNIERTINHIVENGLSEYSLDNIKCFFMEASINAIKTKINKDHWSLIEELIHSENLKEGEESLKEWKSNI